MLDEPRLPAAPRLSDLLDFWRISTYRLDAKIQDITKRDSVVSLIDKHRDELVDLCRKHHVTRLDVFGSATTDDFRRSSDIDFLVEFDSEVNPRRFDNFFELHRALERLFGCPVDLVEPGGLRNPYFIRRVNQTRREVYVAS